MLVCTKIGRATEKCLTFDPPGCYRAPNEINRDGYNIIPTIAKPPMGRDHPIVHEALHTVTNGEQARTWLRILNGYARPSTSRSVAELAVTVVPLIALWVAMVASLQFGYWIALLLSVPAAGLLVRLFLIQHDCGHYSFFKSRWANDLVGRFIGVFTLTPHAYWREAHNIHHATSGNLDRREIGGVEVVTVREYRAMSRWQRLSYRLYRNPLVMLGMGPTYLFVLKFRLPLDMLHGRHKVLMSVMATNLAIFAVIVLVGLVIGFTELAMVQVPITMIASSIGVWLFYVQHQFENVYWSENKDWDFHQAAVEGSSFFDLPWGMRWFTANIGVHHVHHLCSRIPHYRLQACLKQIPELREVNRITLQGSLKTLRLALWDEERRRMVGFRALRQ